MKAIDVKSVIIGVLGTVVVVLGLGLQRQDTAAGRDTVSPRYQLIGGPDGLLVLDNQTLIVTRIAIDARLSKNPNDPPPRVPDFSYSLKDVVSGGPAFVSLHNQK